MSFLAPGSVIGIIGGGQLGRMSAMAAARLGYRTHIFAPEAGSPAAQVAGLHTIADYTDHVALHRFAAAVEVITFEFENIPADSLALLEALKPVRPSAKILQISQDRTLEKRFLESAGVPVAPWMEIHSEEALHAATLPGVLKTTRLGYDGKGQALLRTAEDIPAAYHALHPRPLVLERLIDFACEISVMVARGVDGAISAYDAVENRHKHHILDVTLAPAPVPSYLLEEAGAIARVIAEKLELVGLLGVEMFVTADGKLLVNEIAPRPHNSGHWTIDACAVSQFEMHIRAVAGLPLPPAVRHSDAVMKNLVGPEDMDLWPAVVGTPGLIPHHYGKTEARLGRKMGHYTKLFPKGALPGEFGIADALNTSENRVHTEKGLSNP